MGATIPTDRRIMDRVLLAGIEGAMLAARAHDDVARFDLIARRLLDLVAPTA